MSVLLSGGAIVLSGGSIVLTNSDCPSCCGIPCWVGVTAGVTTIEITGELTGAQYVCYDDFCDFYIGVQQEYSIPTLTGTSVLSTSTCNNSGISASVTSATGANVLYYGSCGDDDTPSLNTGNAQIAATYVCRCPGPEHYVIVSFLGNLSGLTFDFGLSLRKDLLTGVVSIANSAYDLYDVDLSGIVFNVAGVGTDTLVVSVSGIFKAFHGSITNCREGDLYREFTVNASVTISGLSSCSPPTGFECFATPPAPAPTQQGSSPSAASLRSGRGCGCQKVRQLRA